LKFKTIYILFNAVIVAAFLFIFLLPLALLGRDYFRLFAERNWIAALLFGVTLILINGYFAFNWKLFRLLEREDWPQLTRHLEEASQRRGRLRKGPCRLLVNTYLITGNTTPIGALEARVRRDRPALLKSLALSFGLPYLLRLQEDPEAAAAYFGALAHEPGASDRGWLVWNLAFSLMRLKKYDEARTELSGLLGRRCEPALRLLTVYLLDSLAAGHPEARESLDRERVALRRLAGPAEWQRKLESGGGNPQVTLLGPVMREAREWLFSDRVDARRS